MEHILYKNPDYYTSEHNAYMMSMIKSYPGITIMSDEGDYLRISVTEEANAFLEHMNDCDMIVLD